MHRKALNAEPRGYFTHVFEQAAALLKARPELNGDQAYWLARKLVDEAIGAPKLKLDPPDDLTLENPK